MEDPKTKQTGKQISSPIHRSISSMVSPELWDHLWPHSQDEMVNHFRTMIGDQRMDYINDLP